MQINLNKAVETLYGTIIPEGPESDKPLTLKSVCVNALLMDHQDEKLTGKEKFERYLIAKKITAAAEDVSLELEEAVLVKDLVARVYTPIVIGALFEAMG